MTPAQISDRLAIAIAELDEAVSLLAAEGRSCVARVSDDLLALRLDVEREAIRTWKAVEA